MTRPEGNPIYSLLKSLASKSVKAVVATIPDVTKFPYFRFYQVADLKRQTGITKLYAVSDDRYELGFNRNKYVREISEKDIILPSPSIETLRTSTGTKNGLGMSVDFPLPSQAILSTNDLDQFKWLNAVNSMFVSFAKESDTPVVDLHGIYERILQGNYVSDDGVRIDPSFPNGNFFSEDGIYPSAIGQAVLANEWIKVINAHYKTRIPLIRIQQFQAVLK